jgi:Flp pilus assembly protein TadD
VISGVESQARAHYELGLALEPLGDKDGAREEFQKAVALAPGLAEAHKKLAHLAMDSHKWRTAVNEWSAALAWMPGDPDIHSALGVALRQEGSLEEAAEHDRLAEQLRVKAQAP